jgi:hypothetical protein
VAHAFATDDQIDLSDTPVQVGTLLGLPEGSYVFSAKVQLMVIGDVSEVPLVECELAAGAGSVDLSAVQLGFGGVDTIPLSGAASLVASGNAVLTCGGSVDVAATRVRLTATRIDTLIQ